MLEPDTSRLGHFYDQSMEGWPIRGKTFGERTVAPHHRAVVGLIHEIVPTLPPDITSRTVQRLPYSFARHGRA
jgi:hypothetical protein